MKSLEDKFKKLLNEIAMEKDRIAQVKDMSKQSESHKRNKHTSTVS